MNNKSLAHLIFFLALVPKNRVQEVGPDMGSGNGDQYYDLNWNHSERVKKRDDWHTLIPKDYDKSERPGEGASKAASVDISLSISRVHSINEAKMSFGLDFYFRQVWMDPRLSYSPVDFRNKTELDLPAEARDAIWMPDTYFPTMISEEDAHKDRFHLKVRPNGQLWYSTRIAIEADCPMNILYYPFDKQACIFKIGSYGLVSEKMEYKWMSVGEKVTIAETVRLPEFKIIGSHTRSLIEKWPAGNYSMLQMCMILERSAGFCFVQMIIPAAGVIGSSWMALWLDEETTFNDLIAVILAIIFLSYSQNSMMPRVSYIKLMDIYLGACFAFAFISLGKLVLLKYTRRKWEQEHKDNGLSYHEQMGQISWYSSFHRGGQGEEVERKEKGCSTLCCVKFFHFLTQLFLPLLFAAFFVVSIFILPHWNKKNPCWPESS